MFMQYLYGCILLLLRAGWNFVFERIYIMSWLSELEIRVFTNMENTLTYKKNKRRLFLGKASGEAHFC